MVTATAEARGVAPATGAGPILVASNLEVVYSEVILALKGVNLEVGQGECTALLGPNGAGKSTTLKALSALLEIEDGRISGGEVTFRGRPIAGRDASDLVRDGLVHVVEGRRVLRHMTVEQNLKVGGHLLPTGAMLRERLDRVYATIPRLADLKGRTAGYLSGGEQQMLVIGRAMMSDPKLIVLDEPSLGLAPMIIDEVFALLASLKRDGVSLLIVEQNAQAALALADRGYILENGRIVLDGPAEQLRSNQDIQEFYLGMSAEGERRSYREIKHYRRRKRWLG
jgi:branched-chain amino acid transport system ATP-binding protein